MCSRTAPVHGRLPTCELVSSSEGQGVSAVAEPPSGFSSHASPPVLVGVRFHCVTK